MLSSLFKMSSQHAQLVEKVGTPYVESNESKSVLFSYNTAFTVYTKYKNNMR